MPRPKARRLSLGSLVTRKSKSRHSAQLARVVLLVAARPCSRSRSLGERRERRSREPPTLRHARTRPRATVALHADTIALGRTAAVPRPQIVAQRAFPS